MTIEFDNFSKSARGGTEIIKYEVIKRIPKYLLDKFQIVTDRFSFLDENKIRIYWSHLDPQQCEEMLEFLGYEDKKPLANGGWKKFHKIVFVSYHQMENWIKRYNIPRSHCTVIKHAINPIEPQEKPKDKITLVHHCNPQRGLPLLIDVFERLCEEYDNIELKVHSSWKIYGMSEWEENYKKENLYKSMENNPKILNIGYLPNEEVKKSLASSHIFAYPNIMTETFCISLLESMSAGCLCVHPDYGCLPETAANLTMMYSYHDDIDIHKEIFYQNLKKAIEIVNDNEVKNHLKKQKEYVDYLFNWEKRIKDWIDLLLQLENLPHHKVYKSITFSYN